MEPLIRIKNEWLARTDPKLVPAFLKETTTLNSPKDSPSGISADPELVPTFLTNDQKSDSGSNFKPQFSTSELTQKGTNYL